MRISEFSIRRYGPLPDTGRVPLSDFTVLYGKNEYGKTLTIDALVKLLLQKGRTLFERIGRVDEDPEGYIILEDLLGKAVKLPEKGDLTSLTGLKPEESRNIFVIRNSDLSIAAETEFYRNITDRLTGLRTDEIEFIKNQLQSIGKLTRADSTGSLRDWAGEKLKTRIRSAEKLVENIQELAAKVEEEQLDKLEEALVDIRGQFDDTELKINSFEDARKRDKYEKGTAAYQAAISASKELQDLDTHVDEEADLWAGCDNDIANAIQERTRLEQEVVEKKLECAKWTSELDAKALVLQSLSDRKRRIEDEIRPDIKTYRVKSADFKNKETKRGFFTVAAIISAVLLGISVAGIIVNASSFLYALLVISLISTVVFAVLHFSVTREKASLSGMFERIRLAASKYGINKKTIEEIISGIQEFDEVYSERQRELEQIRTRASVLENEVKRIIDNDIANLNTKITEARSKIDQIVKKSGLGKLEDYREKLRQKASHKQLFDTQVGILKSHFGSVGLESGENLAYWVGEIQALKEFENKAADITFDEKVVSQLSAERERFRSEAERMEQKVADFHNELKEIEREANAIFSQEDDYLYCGSSVEMLGIKDRLLNFITQIEENKELALAAISIFESLQKEEEGKISSLFGEDSPISKYFVEITGHLYEEVVFIVNNIRRVQVKLKNGSILDANQLSGGAYDQLYLAIRLALGEKLLKDRRGFFIMDDPFIKADIDRLDRQLGILKKICKGGWQIIYFTAKKEVIELLKSDIEEGKVKYVELKNMLV